MADGAYLADDNAVFLRPETRARNANGNGDGKRPADLIVLRDAHPPAVGPLGDIARLRREVLGRFEERLDDLVEAICGQLAQVDLYGQLGAADARLVRAAVRRSVEVLVRHLRAGEELSDADRAFYRELGIARAEQGMPLEAVRHAFGSGYASSVGHLSIVAGELYPPEIATKLVQDLSPHLERLYDTAQQEISTGHTTATEGRLPPRDLAERRFVIGLLEGTADEDQLHQQATSLGLSLRGPWALLVVVPHQAFEGHIRPAGDELAALFPQASSALTWETGVAHAAVAVSGWGRPSAPNKATLDALAQRRGVVVAVTSSPRLIALGRTYRKFGRLTPMYGHVAYEPAVVPIQRTSVCLPLLDDTPESAAVDVRDTLGWLLADRCRDDRYVDTLELLDHFRWQTSLVAKRLGVSLATVNNRSKRIAQITGLDLEHGDDTLRIALSLRRRRLFPNHMPPRRDPFWSQDDENEGRDA